RAGLLGHQLVAQHRLGIGADLLDRLGDPHAALAAGIVFEMALAAPAGVDLGLHDGDWGPELASYVHRLIPGVGDAALEKRDGKFGQQSLGLIFVDVHAVLLRWPSAKSAHTKVGCETQLTSSSGTL